MWLTSAKEGANGSENGAGPPEPEAEADPATPEAGREAGRRRGVQKQTNGVKIKPCKLILVFKVPDVVMMNPTGNEYKKPSGWFLDLTE